VREAADLLKMAEEDWSKLHARLEGLRSNFLNKDALIINLTGDETTVATSKQALDTFLSSIPTTFCEDGSGNKNENNVLRPLSMRENWLAMGHESHFTTAKQNEGFAIPSQVNYVARGGPIYRPGEEVKGSTSVFTRYLGTTYLWDRIRVVGGAYGGSSSFSESSGVFTYKSYRDPNLAQTLSVYGETGDHVLNEPVGEQELLQAVIGTVGDLDSPMSVDQKGYNSMIQFITGEPQKDRQKWRDEVLGTTPNDFKDIAKRLKSLEKNGFTVVFGSESALKAANEQLDASNKMVIELAYAGTHDGLSPNRHDAMEHVDEE
jgi:Zn-dependent M16 (insulinase) family peptidase